MRSALSALIAGALALGSFASPGTAGEKQDATPAGEKVVFGSMVFVESRFPYAETVKRLKAAIRAQGMKVVFVDDQQATLRRAGVKSPGVIVIEFADTKYTKQIFEIEHAAHMELPLRIGVAEGSEHDPHSKATHILYGKPSLLFARYQGLETIAKELDRVLEAIVATVAARGESTREGHDGKRPEGTSKPGH